MNIENIKKSVHPALHLWWRYTWRIWLFSLFVGIIQLIAAEYLLGKTGGVIFAEMLKTLYTSYTSLHGVRYENSTDNTIASFNSLFFYPVIVFSLWLFKAIIFKKSFYYEGKESSFSIEHSGNILNMPLTWNIAIRLWWGMFWRSAIFSLAAKLLFFWYGNFIFIVEIFGSYLSFLWLLSYNYGKTKIIVHQNR